ncbi:MAG TPA: hypothetical protein VFM45_02415 [Anaeromyxobacteraceae bacterium]|nr:hypothetical protein [Anaeromyxobacteraceae bacterium]
MGHVVVAIFLAVFGLLAAGALALQIIGLSGQARMLERGRGARGERESLE